jgi:hypothetical protein
MGWVEQLKPDDEVTVEIIYPREYVEQSMATIRKYSQGIACLCKGAAVLGEEEYEFLVWDINVLQSSIIEEVFKRFGVELTHEHGKLPSGRRWTYFYADLRGLRKRMNEDGDFDFGEEWK